MKNVVDFTNEEQFVLSYYRDAQLSRWQRFAALQGTLILISFACLALYLIQHDLGWGFVAYVLLLWRACAAIWRARQYTAAFHGIIRKYDAKIAELAAVSDPNKP